MAAVTVPAKIRVVLVKTDRGAAFLGELAGAAHQNAFAGAVMDDQLLHCAALGRAIFRMGMIVVVARAVAEHEIAFDLDKAQFPLRVLGEIRSFIGVLAQFRNMKTAHVRVRIFALVIPAHQNARFGRTAHQGHGLGHHVQILLRVPGNADFGFGAELDDHFVLVDFWFGSAFAYNLVLRAHFNNFIGPI